MSVLAGTTSGSAYSVLTYEKVVHLLWDRNPGAGQVSRCYA
ncbi:MAG: hypothetical protein WAM65_16640 [Candidatus Korobacteraceae bacterium]